MSRLLCNRLEANLDSEQTPDQAGFRKGFCAEDHPVTVTLLHEQCHEWQNPLWATTLDFKKAFDSVGHEHLWIALRTQHVP